MDDLYRITCPVLVIGSEDDYVVGAEASVQIAEHLSDQTDVRYICMTDMGMRHKIWPRTIRSGCYAFCIRHRNNER